MSYTELDAYNGFKAVSYQSDDHNGHGRDPSVNRLFIYEDNGTVLNINANVQNNSQYENLSINGLSTIEHFGYFTSWGPYQPMFDVSVMSSLFHNIVDNIITDYDGNAFLTKMLSIISLINRIWLRVLCHTHTILGLVSLMGHLKYRHLLIALMLPLIQIMLRLGTCFPDWRSSSDPNADDGA